MSTEDLMKMLIEAYEQGLADGNKQADVENSRVQRWHALKERCLRDMKELTTL